MPHPTPPPAGSGPNAAPNTSITPAADARVADALHRLPSFRHWQGRRPPPALRRLAHELDDDQAAMSLAAELLLALETRTPTP